MRMKVVAIAAALAAGLAFTGPVAANPVGSTAKAAQGAQSSMIEHVDHHWKRKHWRKHRHWDGPGHWRYRCYAAREACAYRWGWGSRKFYRCLDNRHCL